MFFIKTLKFSSSNFNSKYMFSLLITVPYNTKLSRDKTFVVRSPCKYSQKNIHVCIKQSPQKPKNFEICGKTFMVQAKSVKVLPPGSFVLYSTRSATQKLSHSRIKSSSSYHLSYFNRIIHLWNSMRIIDYTIKTDSDYQLSFDNTQH